MNRHETSRPIQHSKTTTNQHQTTQSISGLIYHVCQEFKSLIYLASVDPYIYTNNNYENSLVFLRDVTLICQAVLVISLMESILYEQ